MLPNFSAPRVLTFHRAVLSPLTKVNYRPTIGRLLQPVSQSVLANLPLHVTRVQVGGRKEKKKKKKTEVFGMQLVQSPIKPFHTIPGGRLARPHTALLLTPELFPA